MVLRTNAEVLILDEPTIGLDTAARRSCGRLLEKWLREITQLFLQLII